MSRRYPIPDEVWDQHVGILAKTVTAKGDAAAILVRADEMQRLQEHENKCVADT